MCVKSTESEESTEKTGSEYFQSKILKFRNNKMQPTERQHGSGGGGRSAEDEHRPAVHVWSPP